MPLVLRAFRSMLCLILLRSLFLLCLFTPVTPLAFFFASAQADSESSSWLGRATDHAVILVLINPGQAVVLPVSSVSSSKLR